MVTGLKTYYTLFDNHTFNFSFVKYKLDLRKN